MQAIQRNLFQPLAQRASCKFVLTSSLQCKNEFHNDDTRRKPRIRYPIEVEKKSKFPVKKRGPLGFGHNTHLPKTSPYYKSIHKRSKTNGEKFDDISRNQHKCSDSEDILYGIHPVSLALHANRRKIHHIFYKKGVEVNEKINEILEKGKEKDIKISELTLPEFRRIVKGDKVHQGVCCKSSILPFEELTEEALWASCYLKETSDETSKSVKSSKPLLWLYLDQVQDPMNFGAILRTAYYLGVDKVLTSKENCCRISGVVSKASSGVAELFPVHQVSDTQKLFEILCTSNWDVVSTASSSYVSSVPVEDYKARGSSLLIIGNEGRGISQTLVGASSVTVSLSARRELHSGVDSLNVSVATAIILHEMRKKLDAVK